MIKKTCQLLMICCAITLLSSCDDDQKEAAFLVIDNVTVEPLRAGVPETQNITDVWLIVDNELYGVWPLPARIPIEIAEGAQQVLIAPGVRVNGVSGAARQYPYFEFFEVNQVFTSGEEVVVTPRFEYFDIVEVGYEEGFELSNSFAVDLDGDANTAVVRTDSISRLGSHCGEITLSGDGREMLVSNLMRLDGTLLDGPNAYLEIDYKGNLPLLVGYITYGTSIIGDYKVLITESQEWKKLYIDLSNELTASGVQQYQIQLATALEGTNLSEGQVFIDNVRLLHF